MFTEDRLLRKFLPMEWYERLNLPEGHIRRFLRRELDGQRPGLAVLDAGAGEGRYKAYMSGFRYVGLDFGKGDGAWDYTDLDVVGNVLNLPFADDTFDLAVCTQVIEHVTDPQILVAELGRVVRPGGTVLMSSPLGFGEHQQPYDFFRYTQFGLRLLAERAGLTVVSIEPMGGLWTYLWVSLAAVMAFLSVASNQRLWTRLLYLPIRLVLDLLVLILFPLLCPALDRWVGDDSHTMGHCVKLQVPTDTQDEAD